MALYLADPVLGEAPTHDAESEGKEHPYGQFMTCSSSDRPPHEISICNHALSNHDNYDFIVPEVGNLLQESNKTSTPI